MIIAIVIGVTALICIFAALLICKIKRKACFNRDAKIVTTPKHDDVSKNKLEFSNIGRDEAIKIKTQTNLSAAIAVAQPARVNWQDPTFAQ